MCWGGSTFPSSRSIGRGSHTSARVCAAIEWSCRLLQRGRLPQSMDPTMQIALGLCCKEPHEWNGCAGCETCGVVYTFCCCVPR